MDLDHDGIAARGLRRYVRLVAEAVGVGAESSTLQLDDPVSAYLALDRCAPQHPDLDLALLWTERHGWALGLESTHNADVRVLGYLAAELLPPPRTVADYVDSACAGDGFGTPRPCPNRLASEDLLERLAGYADQMHGARFEWLVRRAATSSSGR